MQESGRSMVGADSWYRFRLLGDRYAPIGDEEEAAMDLSAVRSLAEEIGGCTALTQLGVEPPQIDLWACGVETGRVIEVPPAS